MCKTHLEEMIFTWVSLTDPRCHSGGSSSSEEQSSHAILVLVPSPVHDHAGHSLSKFGSLILLFLKTKQFALEKIHCTHASSQKETCTRSSLWWGLEFSRGDRSWVVSEVGVLRLQVKIWPLRLRDKGYKQHADWRFPVWLEVTAVILVHLFDTQHFTAYLSCIAHLRALKDNIPISAGVVQKPIKITGK